MFRRRDPFLAQRLALILQRLGARQLALFHHAPERTDDQIDELLAYHRKGTPDLDLVAAAEGMELAVGNGAK